VRTGKALRRRSIRGLADDSRGVDDRNDPPETVSIPGECL
jgi:hypothetical protein